MKDLQGRVAIVTGASRGIGVDIARALIDRGVRVALAARSADELESVRAAFGRSSEEVIAVTCDVTSGEDRRNLLAVTESTLGPLDILVHNAGIEATGHFDRIEPGSMTHLIEVNLVAPMLFTREVLPGMLERGRGHVVQVASAAGKGGAPFLAPYSASKHGLVGLSASLRAEYHGRPVGFSVVCPGFVTDTGMYWRWQKNGVSAPKTAGSTTPQKVAEAVIKSIVKDRAEILVNTPSLKPTFILGAIAPGLSAGMLSRLGYTKALEMAADLNLSEPDR